MSDTRTSVLVLGCGMVGSAMAVNLAGDPRFDVTARTAATRRSRASRSVRPRSGR